MNLDESLHQDWGLRVAQYLGELYEVVDAMERTLAQFKPQRAISDVSHVNAHTDRLAELAAQLEAMVGTRESLLAAEDAPRLGVTLAEKILQSSLSNHQELAKQCQTINEALKTAHLRAIALFTCQYHLAELSSDILGLIAGWRPRATYDEPGTLPLIGDSATAGNSGAQFGHRSHLQSNHRGGLFNEAG